MLNMCQITCATIILVTCITVTMRQKCYTVSHVWNTSELKHNMVLRCGDLCSHSANVHDRKYLITHWINHMTVGTQHVYMAVNILVE